MAYHVPDDIWKERIESLALGLVDAQGLPPLIVEWRDGNLIICDGSHRHAAMLLKSWTTCFVVIWCNSEEDHRAALSILSQTRPEHWQGNIGARAKAERVEKQAVARDNSCCLPCPLRSPVYGTRGSMGGFKNHNRNNAATKMPLPNPANDRASQSFALHDGKSLE
ncbi:hypothetical protein A6U89_22835 [Agrobacterium sp. B133/95]|nr:hypothetical protein A6U89_22835 [Agrobacterium sp. B133/95]